MLQQYSVYILHSERFWRLDLCVGGGGGSFFGPTIKGTLHLLPSYLAGDYF